MARPDSVVIVQDTAELLAADVAARTLTALAAAQHDGRRAALALTAGSIMEAVWSEIASSAGSSSSDVDWSRVDVFWADERFVPADSSDRNDGPARELLFSKAPFSAARQYPMPASDGPIADLDDAAADYARQLWAARRADDEGAIPSFDVVLLGLGPDGHCASLFPNHPGTQDESGPVIGIRDSPKPPPNRVSLSFDGLDEANEIWLVASGTGKADAVALAHSGAGRVAVPSSGPRGKLHTLWLIDADAASKLS